MEKIMRVFKNSKVALMTILSVSIFSFEGMTEVYYSGYHNTDKAMTKSYKSLSNLINNSKKEQVVQNSHKLITDMLPLTLQGKGYNLYNKGKALSCTGFVNEVFKNAEQHWSFSISTHVTHSKSVFVNKEASKFASWAKAHNKKLAKHFDVFEKEVSIDNKQQFIKVLNPGFRPLKGDILVYPPRYIQSTKKFKSSGHILIVIDPDKCIAAHSSSFTWDKKNFKRDSTKQGPMFHKVNNPARCKDGVWTSWDNAKRNQFWTLLRSKTFKKEVVTQIAPLAHIPVSLEIEAPELELIIPQIVREEEQVNNTAVTVIETPLAENIIIPTKVEIDLPVVAEKDPEEYMTLQRNYFSKQKNFTLGLSILSEVILWSSPEFEMKNICGVTSNDTIFNILERKNGWTKIEMLNIGLGLDLTCETSEFYIMDGQVMTFNYVSDQEKLELSEHIIKKPTLLHLTPEANSPISGFLKPEDKVYILQNKMVDGKIWLLTNKNLSWIEFTI
jgi:hypothetical protein